MLESNGVVDFPCTFENPNTFLDQLYEIPENFQDYDNYNNLISHLSSPYNQTDILPLPEFEPCQFSKRQKCYQDFIPLPEFQIPHGHWSENVKKNDDRSVSAQSIAARERRRKITEKTQELGKLIPVGSKMNTAEMLQAAFKYVKYLQAQVHILEFMKLFQGSKEEHKLEDLNVLVTSPTVEEKLYMDEKCLVPKEFVKELTEHPDIQKRRSISNDLNRLISSRD